MTTSFAWFMRGRVDRSWRANPVGFLLALLTVPLIAWLVSSAVANEPIGFRSLAGPLLGLLVGVVVLSLAFWLIRLIVSPGGLVRPWTNTAAAARSTGM
jgi:cation transporter-like permease